MPDHIKKVIHNTLNYCLPFKIGSLIIMLYKQLYNFYMFPILYFM